MHVKVAGSCRGRNRKNQILVNRTVIALTAEIPVVIGIPPPEIAVIQPDIIIISQAAKAGRQLLRHEVAPFFKPLQ
jgi:hypothetical protein